MTPRYIFQELFDEFYVNELIWQINKKSIYLRRQYSEA